jgi:hypothetical protein
MLLKLQYNVPPSQTGLPVEDSESPRGDAAEVSLPNRR